MITLIFFIVFGYFVMSHGRPLIFAGIYTGVALLIPLILDGPAEAIIISALIIFAYTSFIYWLVDRFGDGIITPLAILVGGAVLLFIAPIFL